MNNWTLLFTTSNMAEANIIKGMLEENSLPVLVMNKQDSSYLNFGYIEIYVQKNFKDIAKELLDKALMN